MRIALPFMAALLLSACGADERREGALTADEEQQLDDAAAMLDERDAGEDGEADEVDEVDEADEVEAEGE